MVKARASKSKEMKRHSKRRIVHMALRVASARAPE